tara:strand:- start:239 stop:973 length:735 start_codon:yes stop_codon:yes gene_type:complete
MAITLLKKGFFNFKKEDPKEKAKQILKKVTLEKVFSLKQKSFNEERFNKTSRIFKIFLMKNFDIEYKFTHSELKKELNKKKIANELKNKIINVSNLITQINYQNKKITKELFYHLLKDIEDIVNLTIITSSIKIDIEALRKKYIKKKAQETIKEKAAKEIKINLPKEKEISRSDLLEVEHVFKSITDAQNALLSFNLEKAKDIYSNILYTYRKLPHEQQEDIYPSIKELYHTRKRLSYVLKSLT